ncbi:hypothetical protein K438DRAFT_2119110 [Mycena galopus ATCC 62051]|nr:hypothetical protein K438DRAFT_2119110 [Mycena galopus ATCC 62051]
MCSIVFEGGPLFFSVDKKPVAILSHRVPQLRTDAAVTAAPISHPSARWRAPATNADVTASFSKAVKAVRDFSALMKKNIRDLVSEHQPASSSVFGPCVPGVQQTAGVPAGAHSLNSTPDCFYDHLSAPENWMCEKLNLVTENGGRRGVYSTARTEKGGENKTPVSGDARLVFSRDSQSTTAPALSQQDHNHECLRAVQEEVQYGARNSKGKGRKRKRDARAAGRTRQRRTSAHP